jgi:hypothetical protein
MICKGHIPKSVHTSKAEGTAQKGLIRNREYTVTSISTKTVELRDPDEKGQTIRLYRETFDDNFALPYCMTCHSVIGLTLDKKITIFDWEEYNVSAEWFWTALTRTTSLKDVSLYTGKPISNTPENREMKRFRSHVRKKIQGHKTYDMKSALHDPDHFVTEEWVITEL